MFKRIIALCFVAALMSVPIVAQTLTINEVQIGATASATPTSAGTSTPVAILHCGATLNAGNSNTNTTNMLVCVSGGTSGTDYIRMAPAPVASPCAAASPAPNISTKVGIPVLSGGTVPNCYPINYPSQGGAAILSSEWDAVADTAGLTIERYTFP